MNFCHFLLNLLDSRKFLSNLMSIELIIYANFLNHQISCAKAITVKKSFRPKAFCNKLHEETFHFSCVSAKKKSLRTEKALNQISSREHSCAIFNACQKGNFRWNLRKFLVNWFKFPPKPFINNFLSIFRPLHHLWTSSITLYLLISFPHQ